jgi:hypothetical protein
VISAASECLLEFSIEFVWEFVPASTVSS